MPEESNKLITEGAKISNQNTGETDSNQPEFYYELSLWFYPSFTEAEINEKFNSLIKNIEALNGVILSMESPQLRPLSYEILDNNNGFWGFISFELASSKINELLNELRSDSKSILRHLLTKRRKEKPHSVSRKLKTYSNKKIKEVESGHHLNLEELDKKLDALLKE